MNCLSILDLQYHPIHLHRLLILIPVSYTHLYLRDRIGKKALKVRTSEGLQIEDFYAVADDESTPEEVVEEEIIEDEVSTEEVTEEKTEKKEDERTADKDSK